MKFHRIGPNRVKSSAGFILWMKNPFQLHYSENLHEVIIPGEMLTGETELLVSVSTIKFWSSPSREVVDDATKERIVHNVGEALRFMGIRYEFD